MEIGIIVIHLLIYVIHQPLLPEKKALLLVGDLAKPSTQYLYQSLGKHISPRALTNLYWQA